MMDMNKRGFTLVELMLAMSLFIFVMMVATVGFVGINRTFTKGMVRKDLSEGVQRLTESITLTIRNEGQLANLQEAADAGENLSQLCASHTCYVWGKGVGLKKTKGEVTEVVLDERYKVDFLKVTSLTGDLYRVSGIVRTNEDSDFNYDKDKYPNDTQEISCKGSAEVGVSKNCALEKFSFVVSVGGARVSP